MITPAMLGQLQKEWIKSGSALASGAEIDNEPHWKKYKKKPAETMQEIFQTSKTLKGKNGRTKGAKSEAKQKTKGKKSKKK